MTGVLRVLCGGISVGQLAEKSGVIVFQYDQSWLQQGFDLAPGSMPFDAQAHKASRLSFDGLHGVFNDSLPDGWGLLLMDRALKKYRDLDPGQITPLDRLAYMGHRGMGALTYEPELIPGQDTETIELADIAAQSEDVLRGDTQEVLETLRLCGGSPGGARPKVTVAFSEDMATCLSGFGNLPPGYTHWIVKFRNDDRYGQGDPAYIGRLEMAYADMARAAGLDVPRTRLIELSVNRRSEAYFSVERFDRVDNRKIHFLSLAGYAYASHREPCLDYGTGVLPATKKLTRSANEVTKAFRLMLFNVLAHNKDDHSKNFAYLFDPLDSQWRLAPAYDLTFNDGMANSHTTAINGSGNPGFADIKQVAMARHVEGWQDILEEVRTAVSRWPEFARNYDMANTRTQSITRALAAIDKDCSTA